MGRHPEKTTIHSWGQGPQKTPNHPNLDLGLSASTTQKINVHWSSLPVSGNWLWRQSKDQHKVSQGWSGFLPFWGRHCKFCTAGRVLGWPQWMARRSLLLLLPLTRPHFPSHFHPLPSSPLPHHHGLQCASPLQNAHFFLFLHDPLSVVLSHYVSDSFPSGQFLSSVLVAGWIFNLLLVIAARTSEMSLFCLCTWLIVSVGIKFQVENHLPPEHSIIFSFPKFLLGKLKPFEFWFFRCCLPTPLPGTS